VQAHQRLEEKERHAEAARASATRAAAEVASAHREAATAQLELDNIVVPMVTEAREDYAEARAKFVSAKQEAELLPLEPDALAAKLKAWDELVRAEARVCTHERWLMAYIRHVGALRTADLSELEEEAARLENVATSAENDAARFALSVEKRFGRERATKLSTLWAVMDCLEDLQPW